MKRGLMTASAKKWKVAVLAGDGIGPEVRSLPPCHQLLRAPLTPY